MQTKGLVMGEKELPCWAVKPVQPPGLQLGSATPAAAAGSTAPLAARWLSAGCLATDMPGGLLNTRNRSLREWK